MRVKLHPLKTNVTTAFAFTLFISSIAIVSMFALGRFDVEKASADLAPATVTVTPHGARSIAQYTVTFNGVTSLNSIEVGETITVTFNDGTGVPSSVAASAIQLKSDVVGGEGIPNQLVNPTAVAVSGRVITITVPDMDPGSTGGSIGDNNIAEGATVTITFIQAAGIRNPNLAGSTYTLTVTTTGDPVAVISGLYTITSFVNYSPGSAARGDTVTVTGGGFIPNCVNCEIRLSPQNVTDPVANTPVGFGSIDANGVFAGSITLTSSTSAGGFVWVTDSSSIFQVSATAFVQTARAIPRSFTTAAGSTVTVDLVDFTPNAVMSTSTSVVVSATAAVSTALTIPASGETTEISPFEFVVPLGTTIGTHLVTITDGIRSANFNLEVTLRILTVIPNPAAIGQEITISGTGFDKTNGTIAIASLTAKAGNGTPVALNTAVITIDTTGAFAFTATVPTIETFASSTSDAITITATDNNGVAGSSTSSGFSRTKRTLTLTPATASPGTSVTVNVTGMTVDNNEAGITVTADFTITSSPALVFPASTTFPVDSDGSGTGVVTIPIGTAPATYTLRATDNASRLNADASGVRTAQAKVKVPTGAITVEPAEASTGNPITITGFDFPPNTAGVTMAIGGANAMPIGGFATDASGEFSAQTVVPGAISGGSLPPGAKIVVVTVGWITGTTIFSIPQPTMTIAPSTATAGDTITISGTGFNAFSTVTTLTIGSQAAMPGPAPVSAGNGDIEANTIVPLLPPGTYTVVMSNAPGFSATGLLTVVIDRPIVCGDVHPAGGGDGDDDVFDALRKLKIAVGLINPTPHELTAGDVHPANESGPDGDGDIDMFDALLDLKAAVGLATITSCGGSS